MARRALAVFCVVATVTLIIAAVVLSNIARWRYSQALSQGYEWGTNGSIYSGEIDPSGTNAPTCWSHVSDARVAKPVAVATNYPIR
jgi:hypothetical protein